MSQRRHVLCYFVAHIERELRRNGRRHVFSAAYRRVRALLAILGF